jgi:hypothetical protein
MLISLDFIAASLMHHQIPPSPALVSALQSATFGDVPLVWKSQQVHEEP